MIRGPNWQADCPKCVASKFTCDEHFTQAQCPNSPDGRCHADTSMETGPNNYFYCERSTK